MTATLLLATRDDELARRVAPALRRAGYAVEVVRSNLELVFRLAARDPSARPPMALVLDARGSSLGAPPLSWLREEPACSAVFALGDLDDEHAHRAAELLDAAAFVGIARGRKVRVGRLVQAIRRALGDPRLQGEWPRWTPARGSRRRQPAPATSGSARPPS